MKALRIFSIVFFFLQIYFVIWGMDRFNKFENPIYLFLSFAGLAVCFGLSICRTDFPIFSLRKVNSIFKIGLVVFSLFLFAICAQELNNLFHHYSNPIKISDVLPQLDAQYNHFALGETPYQPVVLATHTPYPVYMPLHWLPISISRVLQIDTRWSGVILLFAAILLLVITATNRSKSLMLQLLCVIAPVAILYAFAIKGEADIAVSYELVIAAYYLVLAVGLLQKNLAIIVVGIVLCLLSRYTFIFWLPFFFILLYLQIGLRKTAILLATIISAFCIVYVFPFLLKDPTIFLRGLKYHNDAAISEWKGNAYSFEWGIYFAPHINSLIEGSAEHKVFVARAIQATTMLLLLFLGLFFYKRNKHRANHFDISLGMLYSFIVCFYLFGPLSYRYYFIVPLYLSAVLMTRILLSKKRVID